MADLGTFVYGDTGTDTEITLVPAPRAPVGQVIDLTGATAISLEASSSGRDRISVAGSLSGPPSNGKLIFEDLGAAFAPTAQRPLVYFEGYVKWTQDGELFYSLDQVKFAIRLFP